MSLNFTNGSFVQDGYIIVGKKLFDVEEGFVLNKYTLEGNNLEELEKNAREQAKLDDCEIIYYNNTLDCSEDEEFDFFEDYENYVEDDIVEDYEDTNEDDVEKYDDYMDDEEKEGWKDIVEHLNS